MLVGAVVFDYARFTTFDVEIGNYFMDFLGDGMGEGRVMQYQGIKSRDAFAGEAMQKSSRHFLYQVSGGRSHDVCRVFRLGMYGRDLRSTRLDVQLTIPLPDNYSARVVADFWRDCDRWGNGRPANIRLQENTDGLDTVYIGSRTSERYVRVYVKEDDMGARYLRFEVEYKGDLSRKVWGQFLDSELGIYELLRGELDRLPGLPLLLRDFGMFLLEVDSVGVAGSKRVLDDAKTMRWLRDSVTPALERMLNSHDYSGDARRLVLEWNELAGR